MGKDSIAQGSDPRKKIFTASELAELAGFDAALDAEEILLTRAERKLSRELDRVARAEAETGDETGDEGGDGLPRRSAPRNDGKPETAEQRAARLEKKRLWREEHREQLRLSSARYNEAHRQERRDYQKAYDAAKKAAKRKEKGHG